MEDSNGSKPFMVSSSLSVQVSTPSFYNQPKKFASVAPPRPKGPSNPLIFSSSTVSTGVIGRVGEMPPPPSTISDDFPPPPPPLDDAELPAPPPECQLTPPASEAPPPAFPAPPPVADDLPLPAPPEDMSFASLNSCPPPPPPPPPPPAPPLPQPGTGAVSQRPLDKQTSFDRQLNSLTDMLSEMETRKPFIPKMPSQPSSAPAPKPAAPPPTAPKPALSFLPPPELQDRPPPAPWAEELRARTTLRQPGSSPASAPPPAQPLGKGPTSAPKTTFTPSQTSSNFSSKPAPSAGTRAAVQVPKASTHSSFPPVPAAPPAPPPSARGPAPTPAPPPPASGTAPPPPVSGPAPPPSARGPAPTPAPPPPASGPAPPPSVSGPAPPPSVSGPAPPPSARGPAPTPASNQSKAPPSVNQEKVALPPAAVPQPKSVPSPVSSYNKPLDSLSSAKVSAGPAVGAPPAGAPLSMREVEELERMTKDFIKDMDKRSPVSSVPTEVCGKCGEALSRSQPAVRAMDRLFHSQCFCCVSCHRPLQGLQFYDRDGAPECEDCYVNSLAICARCGERIMDRVLKAVGQCFHAHCFRCSVCSCTLEGAPFITDDAEKPYCVPDYHRRFSPLCVSCNEPIVPDPGSEETVRVVALEKNFHLKCYRCEDCARPLSIEADADGCYPLDGRILCMKCHTKRAKQAMQ